METPFSFYYKNCVYVINMIKQKTNISRLRNILVQVDFSKSIKADMVVSVVIVKILYDSINNTIKKKLKKQNG